LVLSAGGGPAGVVEFEKLNNPPGFVGAGVVEPVGAELAALPNNDGPEDGAAPPKRPPDVEAISLFGVLVTGVDPSFPLSAGPKLKPPPFPTVLEPCTAVVLPPPNNPLLGVVELVLFPPPKSVLPPLALPVLAPKSEGVDAPEAGLDPAFPKREVFGAPAVLLKPPNVLPVDPAVDVPPNKLLG
jgi:hypothetical protein